MCKIYKNSCLNKKFKRQFVVAAAAVAVVAAAVESTASVLVDGNDYDGDTVDS